MNRDEHNRRRERDRARRAAETSEEAEAARRREYDRNKRAVLTTEQRETINASRRERRQ